MNIVYCLQCKQPIPWERARHWNAKYCSVRCHNLAQIQKYHAQNPRPVLATPTMGAISEYRVIVDLLNRNLEVFKSCSPSCSCDLAILKDGKLLRVEVTTGKYSATGKIMAPKHAESKYDIIATALFDKILYQPNLDSFQL